jgi:predicted transcriptional regulator
MSEGEVVRDIMMKEGDEYVPVELKLTGYPILVWTAQTPPSDPQHLSRVMPYNIDVSKEQRERVREFSSFEEDTPQELRYPSEIKELERTIKNAIEILKENRKPILNPFARLINTCMSIESPNVNRDRYKFFSLVASITHLYQFQRETIKIKDQEYLITSPIDVLYAIYLGEEDFKVLFGSLDAISQRGYNIIKDKKEPISTSLSLLKARAKDKNDKDDSAVAINELENKSFTNSDVEDWLNVSYKTVARITRNLFKKGVLERDKKGREYGFYLLSEGSKAKTNGVILFDSQRMLEGLMDESTIAKWVNRQKRLYSHEPPHTHTYICEHKKLCLSPDDLDNIYVPDAKIDVDIYTPLWGRSGEYNETEETEHPQTFKYLTENGYVLRDTRRAKEESSDKGVKVEEDAEVEQSEKRQPIEIKKIILEVGKCKSCGKEEIDLIYVVHYSNDEFENVCDACGNQIMRDYGLKLSGGDSKQ